MGRLTERPELSLVMDFLCAPPCSAVEVGSGLDLLCTGRVWIIVKPDEVFHNRIERQRLYYQRRASSPLSFHMKLTSDSEGRWNINARVRFDLKFVNHVAVHHTIFSCRFDKPFDSASGRLQVYHTTLHLKHW